MKIGYFFNLCNDVRNSRIGFLDNNLYKLVCVIDLSEISNLYSGFLVFYNNLDFNNNKYEVIYKKDIKDIYINNIMSYVDFIKKETYPSYDDYSIFVNNISYENYKKLNLDNIKGSRFLGFPFQIQLNYSYLCAKLAKGFSIDSSLSNFNKNIIAKKAAEWILLLELDLDILDSGALYYYINVNDLNNGDFSKVICFVDTY